jgi:hypothetical protein
MPSTPHSSAISYDNCLWNSDTLSWLILIIRTFAVLPRSLNTGVTLSIATRLVGRNCSTAMAIPYLLENCKRLSFKAGVGRTLRELPVTKEI